MAKFLEPDDVERFLWNNGQRINAIKEFVDRTECTVKAARTAFPDSMSLTTKI